MRFRIQMEPRASGQSDEEGGGGGKFCLKFCFLRSETPKRESHSSTTNQLIVRFKLTKKNCQVQDKTRTKKKNELP